MGIQTARGLKIGQCEFDYGCRPIAHDTYLCVAGDRKSASSLPSPFISLFLVVDLKTLS